MLELLKVSYTHPKTLHEGNGKTVYQGVELTNHTEGITFLKTNFGQFVDSVLKCLNNRFKCQNVELFKHTIKLLATQGWEKTDDASFGYDSLAYFTRRFSIPLENANVVTTGVG